MKQYQKLFEMDGVELEFTDDALEADRRPGHPARHRRARAAGDHGRGPQLPVMYDIPSRDDVAKVVVTEQTVKNNVNPTIVPRQPARRERRDKSA